MAVEVSLSASEQFWLQLVPSFHYLFPLPFFVFTNYLFYCRDEQSQFQPGALDKAMIDVETALSLTGILTSLFLFNHLFLFANSFPESVSTLNSAKLRKSVYSVMLD